jgi:succinate dehydrogenase hydrophobic anchor subunit
MIYRRIITDYSHKKEVDLVLKYSESVVKEVLGLWFVNLIMGGAMDA